MKGVTVMSMENKCVSYPMYHGQRKTASNIVDFVDMVIQQQFLNSTPISNIRTKFKYKLCRFKS